MAIYILLKKMVTNKFAIFVKPPLFIKSNIFVRPLKPTQYVSFWTNSIHMACHIGVFVDFDILKVFLTNLIKIHQVGNFCQIIFSPFCRL